VKGVVDSYSSHGAYVKMGDVNGYVPLRLMGDPMPRSARDVMKIGDEVSLEVVSVVATRRSIDLKPTGRRGSSKVVEETKVSPAKKVAAKKVATKKAPVKKVEAKKEPAKKATVKKEPAKKVAVKKAVVKKSAPKKAVVKKVAPKKAAPKKVVAKKAVAKKGAVK